MAHCNTVMSQMLKIFSRHEFEALAREHHSGRKFRKFDRWSQFVAMASAQLSSRTSLRDLVANLSAQAGKLYHLGLKPTNRSTLARVNNEKPHTLYEALFGKLLSRCLSVAPNPSVVNVTTLKYMHSGKPVQAPLHQIQPSFLS